MEHMREEERERAHERASEPNDPGSPPPLSIWALFIGEVERVVYTLFQCWGDILQIGPQIFTTRSLETVLKSLYL
jgi:hypothetical protein